MVLITQSGPETLAIGKKGPDFSLPGTDGKGYSLDSFAQSKLVVISFTCNHCPYAQAYEERFNTLAREFEPQGVSFVAINANDAENYPDDSFDKMKERAQHKQYPFPYLYDESQETAKAYGAVCTPHIFVLDEERKLAYEGRIDDNWKQPDKAQSHDLREAITKLLNGLPAPTPQTNPMGCSIKWKS
jgi:peroxiredoxin